jgi:BolA protein
MTTQSPDMAQSRAARLQAVLARSFAPLTLTIQDDSARHAGHAGAQAEGQTHYSVVIVSASFQGVGRVERSRRVHAVLAEEFASGLHALSLTLRAPSEVNS